MQPFENSGDAHKENRSHHASEDDLRLPVKPLAPAAAQHYDATDDIQDIDRRLNALQQFLEAAKAPR